MKRIILFNLFFFTVINYTKSQDNLQERLIIDTILNIEGDFSYQSPRNSFVSAYLGSQILFLENNPVRKKNTYFFKGFFINLETKIISSIAFNYESKKLEKEVEIISMSLRKNELFINLENTQLLYKINNKKDKLTFVDAYSYPNINTTVYLDDKNIYLSRIGKFNSYEIYKENFLTSVLKKDKSVNFSHEINLEGDAFYLFKPAKFIDINKNWAIWVDPTSYELYAFNLVNQTIDTINHEHKNWKLISNTDLRLSKRLNDYSETIALLGDVGSEISRVWELNFINDTTLIVMFNQPNSDNKYNFFLDVLKIRNNKWLFENKEIKLENWLEFPIDSLLNRRNFPSRFNYFGNLSVISEKYICILTEENTQKYNGKTYKEYFMADRNNTYGLKIHIFKHNLTD